MSQIDRNFENVFQELRAERAAWRAEMGTFRTEVSSATGDLRDEMRAGFGELRTEIGDVRDELRGGIGGLRDELGGQIGGLRGDVSALQHQVNNVLTRLSVALLGLLGVGMAAMVTALLKDGL